MGYSDSFLESTAGCWSLLGKINWTIKAKHHERFDSLTTLEYVCKIT
jgi:hypothetical protein